MNEQQEQIVSILHKLTANEPLTSDEHSLLMAWANGSSFHDDLLKKVQDDEQLANAVFQRLNEDKTPAWNNVVNLLSLQQTAEPVSETGSRLRFLRSTKYWVAAAMIILFVSVAYFLLQRREKPQQVVETKINNDALPGKNGAILTLSDGSKVVLDSLANGLIAHQGKATVILEDGKLQYDQAASSKNNGAQNEPLTYNTITTPKGRQYQLVLPDGSKVWLNAASSIRYPVAFTGSERIVEVSGEVYFEVTPLTPKGGSKKAPFIVKLRTPSGDGGEVVVLGTHFNVNAYPDETNSRITLLEGSVQVNGPFAANRSAKAGVVIKPGQQVVVNNQKDALNINNKVDVEAVMAWKEGYFSFNQTTLADVMRQLARWYDVEVVYEGPAPTMTFWGGISRTSNLSQVVKILEKSNVHFSIENKKIIVTK
jgi:ferric-dicitrate binding protein FerR (iron transport regulator)